MINNFTNIEIIILFIIFLAILLPFRLIDKSNKLSIVNPLIIFSIIISYFTFISPVFRIFTNDTIDRGIDFRDLFIYGWVGSLVLIISTYIGYFSTNCKSFKKYRVCNLSSNQLWDIGFWINNVGIFGYLLVAGISIAIFNPFMKLTGSFQFFRYTGQFNNYLVFAQDFLITGNILMISSFMRNKNKGLITFTYLIITIGLYLNSGFRYKLLFLTFPIFLLYFLLKNLSPKIYFLYLSTGFISFGLIYTIIERIRTYGSGFNLEKLDGYNILDLFINIFKIGETSVFLTTSGLISIIPSEFPHVYFYPFYKVLIHPIPREFLDKNPGDYINDALLALYQDRVQVVGAAMHNYGEYYLMFGWLGIIIGGYLLGVLMKKIWIWILIHQDEEIALPLYLLNISYLYIIISRGYLPQQFQLYAFAILPITITYIINRKKIKTNKI